MTTHSTHSTRTTSTRRGNAGALAAMYAGLLLTIAATVAPFVDRATGHVLAGHVRHGYPSYTPDRVDSAVTAWLVILGVVGALGVMGWVVSIWAVRAGTSWARWVSTVLLAAGAALALTALLVKDTSGEVGLTPLLGWIGLLPSVAGVVAVSLLWRASAARGSGPRGPGQRRQTSHIDDPRSSSFASERRAVAWINQI
ncbi:hypothetical protein [Marmoricola sp. URHB0036]|uniref:hypothetical protein n=1 Tax=Marmoricola sp. URHB0036 TaxID=1298863 RepID=UPI00040F7E06|nr:hypothetical protein [Marmoricola sp. URHB0036]